MGLIDNINKLFHRESVSSNIGISKKKQTVVAKVVNKKGFIKYKEGKDLLLDTQVSTGFDILKYILSSKQWVLIANENDETGEVYDFISDMLFNMETEFQEVVKQQVTAIPWGFSVHEQLYDLNEDGRIYLKGTVPLHMKTLQNYPFTYNDDGELVSIHQEYDNESVDIPINKILKYSFNANYDEDYGNGLLYDFRPIVEDKRAINDWLMTFLERHESPTLYGKVGNSTSRDAMLDGLTDISDGTTNLVMDIEDDVGVLESSHRGETFFSTLQYKDNQIFRRYYLGNLLLGDNSQTGTYAQSKTQLDFGQLIFDGILEEIANCWQKQVINRIVEWNFGDIHLAPTIGFDKFTTGDLQLLFTSLQPLIEKGIVDGENKAVQDSIALMFKKETGLQYTNEEPEMPEENFQLPENGEELTSNIIDNLV